MRRFFYSFGHKSLDAAKAALEHCFATGEVSESEQPEIVSYMTKKGRRWGIQVNGA